MVYTRRRPLGVVGLITPWNFPAAIPTWKMAPALAYGNTVVLKLAQDSPLTGLHLARALEEAELPSGVLNVVIGPAPTSGSRSSPTPACGRSPSPARCRSGTESASTRPTWASGYSSSSAARTP